MIIQVNKPIGFLAGLVAALAALTGGCTGDFLSNLIEERSGNISVIIINNTPYRASFTIGAYDALALNPVTAPDLDQRRVEAMTSTAPFNLNCVRNVAIGTAELVERVIETEGDLANGFDQDAFSEFVNFSSAPIDDEAAALPTIGTADGLEVFLGVDFACGDQLIFTFQEDATAPGGFRIDYSVLQTGADE
jgi:hypothetical protein